MHDSINLSGLSLHGAFHDRIAFRKIFLRLLLAIPLSLLSRFHQSWCAQKELLSADHKHNKERACLQTNISFYQSTYTAFLPSDHYRNRHGNLYQSYHRPDNHKPIRSSKVLSTVGIIRTDRLPDINLSYNDISCPFLISPQL